MHLNAYTCRVAVHDSPWLSKFHVKRYTLYEDAVYLWQS